MQRRLSTFVFLILLGSLAFGLACQGRSTTVRREKMVREFVAILPDSLDSEHRLEIEQIFDTFYSRANQGKIADADVKHIENEAYTYVRKGRITATDLVHFMAEVGYTTYTQDSSLSGDQGK